MDSVTAIIVAAGKGLRMKSEVRKQYLNIAGRPIVLHSLMQMDACKLVDALQLVLPGDDLDYCRDKILNGVRFRCPVKLVRGGRKRQESVMNGLRAVEGRGLVLIHDGVRPLVRSQLIETCISEARSSGACVPGLPVHETIKEVDQSRQVRRTMARRHLWLIQTPQAFQFDIIYKAHVKALEDGFSATDDAMLVENLGQPVKVVFGSKDNIKITTGEDLAIAEVLMASRMKS